MEDWIQHTASHDDISIRSSPSNQIRFQVPFHLRFIGFGSVELNPHVKVGDFLLLSVSIPLHDKETHVASIVSLPLLLAIAPCSVGVNPIYARERLIIIHLQTVRPSSPARN